MYYRCEHLIFITATILHACTGLWAKAFILLIWVQIMQSISTLLLFHGETVQKYVKMYPVYDAFCPFSSHFYYIWSVAIAFLVRQSHLQYDLTQSGHFRMGWSGWLLNMPDVLGYTSHPCGIARSWGTDADCSMCLQHPLPFRFIIFCHNF